MLLLIDMMPLNHHDHVSVLYKIMYSVRTYFQDGVVMAYEITIRVNNVMMEI
jgi:hypothetical protein